MEGISPTKIDPSHPYYLDESESTMMQLVNIEFDGSGYGVWRRLMHLALFAMNKAGFIDGSYPKPSAESPLLVYWTRSDAMVMCWILNSLSKEIANRVIYSHTAKGMWDELERRFGESYGEKLYRLHKALRGLTQGNNDIATYFTKLRSIWNELDSLNAYMNFDSDCKCGAKLKFHKAEEDKKLFQFLIGLNQSYIGIRGKILMMSPLPSLGKAYSLLLQEEMTRKVQ